MVVGCGKSRPDTHEVTGQVYYNNQPVDGASVVFTGDGPPAKATTDADGKFNLRTFAEGDGALVGRHRVTITKNIAEPSTPEDPYPITTNKLPARYARPESSQLTADVTDGGENVFRFDLSD